MAAFVFKRVEKTVMFCVDISELTRPCVAHTDRDLGSILLYRLTSEPEIGGACGLGDEKSLPQTWLCREAACYHLSFTT